MRNNTQYFEMPKSKSYLGISIIITFVSIYGTAALFIFLPNFWFHIPFLKQYGDMSFFEAFNKTFIIDKSVPWKTVIAYCSWVVTSLLLTSLSLTALPATRSFISVIKFKDNYTHYLERCSKIINSCNLDNFNPRVAMVVSTCNDILPSTILQTAKQTYKNMDVWICDDSNRDDIIHTIDTFAKQHNFHVLHRNPEHKKTHPTKLGNLFYFIEKYGDNYDYVFENDSSSIVSPTFVENCLRFYNSPLLNHTKDGGIICNGGFYGTKMLLPFLYSKAWQLGEATSFVGATLQISGHPVPLNGWGCMYPISTLKQIPIKDVECPSCDLARGMWLSARGYKNYLNPFDFASKMCTQNMEAVKNQQLKWHGAEVFLYRNGVMRPNNPNKNISIFLSIWIFSTIISLPVTFSLGLLLLIFSCALNFFYINFTAPIFVVLPTLIIFILLIILFIVKKAPLLSLLCFALFYGLTFGAIVYRKTYQNIVRGFIQKKWSSGAVTVKGIVKTTPKQKLRMIALDLCIICIATSLCLILTFTLNDAQLNKFIIWFNIFFFISGPSWLYILNVILGEIRVKTGWDSSLKEYRFWLYDFRYKYVKNTKIWKNNTKQH